MTFQTPVSVAGVSLRTVLAEPGAPPIPQDVMATSCTNEAGSVRPGDVFVALDEGDRDGHDEVDLAVSRGAVAVVCDRQLPVFRIPQFIVSDSRVAYGKLCQALVGNPSQQLKVIGVTGTAGKTTVARLIGSILRSAGAEVGTIDSLGCFDGWDHHSANDTPLTQPVLARRLGRMAAAGLTHAVVEISSRELSQATFAGVQLDSACITHVGRDHLDWHNSVENYRRAKERIFDQLSEDGLAVLNADDPVSVKMLDNLNHPALTIGLKQPAEITADIIEQHINEQTFVLSAGSESSGIRTAIIGDHHIYNCLTAAAICLAYDIDMTTVARGLEAVDELPGNMQRVACGQEFSVLVDSAHTPDTLRACLRAARQATSGRLICVCGAPGEQETHDRPVIGRVVGAMSDVAVITSNEPRGEEPGQISVTVRDGLSDQSKAMLIADRVEAIAWALEEARAGDTVVVTGMGQRHYCRSQQDNYPLTDCEVVRQALRGKLATAGQFRLVA